MPSPQRILLALLLALLAGCRQERVAAKASFYVWRTRLELSQADHKALSELKVQRLRVRLFDVVRDGDGIHPVGKLHVASMDAIPVTEILPVVFLREAVFRGTPVPAGLAGQILSERDKICQEGKLRCRGMELDCDWTPGSRQGYFDLCKVLSDSLHARNEMLHSTLRLHQYHSPAQTGVPPVDRLTLMAYNMGPTTASPARQSILDMKELARWLDTKSVYPKPLDVALPLYSWALVVRDGNPVDILQQATASELDSLPWLEARSDGLWKAKQGFFLHGLWIRKDDGLKLESPDVSSLRKAADLLARKLPAQTDREVIYFDLSESALAAHPAPELRDLQERLGTDSVKPLPAATSLRAPNGRPH